MMVYFCIKFSENIFSGFRVLNRTDSWTDRRLWQKQKQYVSPGVGDYKYLSRVYGEKSVTRVTDRSLIGIKRLAE